MKWFWPYVWYRSKMDDMNYNFDIHHKAIEELIIRIQSLADDNYRLKNRIYWLEERVINLEKKTEL